LYGYEYMYNTMHRQYDVAVLTRRNKKLDAVAEKPHHTTYYL